MEEEFKVTVEDIIKVASAVKKVADALGKELNNTQLILFVASYKLFLQQSADMAGIHTPIFDRIFEQAESVAKKICRI